MREFDAVMMRCPGCSLLNREHRNGCPTLKYIQETCADDEAMHEGCTLSENHPTLKIIADLREWIADAPHKEDCSAVLKKRPCDCGMELRSQTTPVLLRKDTQAELSLRNVLVHAMRLRRRAIKGPPPSKEDLEHFIRFCAEAGVEPTILRGDET